MKITIDGPSGAGKSTIAKIVAHDLGFIYIDTGAMYRAVGLYILSKNCDIKNETKNVIKLLNEINIDIKYINNIQHVFLNNQDVNSQIRTPEVSVAASNVAVIPQVREKLVQIQRKLAENADVIMDGRDAGTHVLPDAEIKIYLTASVEDRAKRRHAELISKNIKTSYEEVLTDMKYRDENDSSREFAPLSAADDAYIIDTTGNTLQESILIIKNYINENLLRKVKL